MPSVVLSSSELPCRSCLRPNPKSLENPNPRQAREEELEALVEEGRKEVMSLKAKEEELRTDNIKVQQEVASLRLSAESSDMNAGALKEALEKVQEELKESQQALEKAQEGESEQARDKEASESMMKEARDQLIKVITPSTPPPLSFILPPFAEFSPFFGFSRLSNHPTALRPQNLEAKATRKQSKAGALTHAPTCRPMSLNPKP